MVNDGSPEVKITVAKHETRGPAVASAQIFSYGPDKEKKKRRKGQSEGMEESHEVRTQHERERRTGTHKHTAQCLELFLLN